MHSHLVPKYLMQKPSASLISPNFEASSSQALQTLSLSPPLSAKTFLYAATTAGSTFPSATLVSAFFMAAAFACKSASDGGAADMVRNLKDLDWKDNALPQYLELKG